MLPKKNPWLVRERNAIVFFLFRNGGCSAHTLFRLLYLLDFQHFAETGRSVTGLTYLALESGPAPASLFEAIACSKDLPDHLAATIAKKNDATTGQTIFAVKPEVRFDGSLFSPRQLRLLEDLVAGDPNVESKGFGGFEAHHAAWVETWRGGDGRNAPIPYELAIAADHPHRAELLEAAAENRAIDAAFGAERQPSPLSFEFNPLP